MVNDLFLKACRREYVDRTPVWFMRQAGRYLKDYKKLRAKYDFLTLCKTPELAAEISVQPVNIIDVDACIIFSDILVIPEAMGMKLFFEEGKGGPKFETPIRCKGEIESLEISDVNQKLHYVFDAIRITKQMLSNRVPLIGFSGSPFTLATYMVEGGSSKEFVYIKELIRKNSKTAHLLLEKLTKTIIQYLKQKINVGVQAIQIFDTWGGILNSQDFNEYSLRYLDVIVKALKSENVPIILFCKNCMHSLLQIVNTGCDVVSLDSSANIVNAIKTFGNRCAFQGNLDPKILLNSKEAINNSAIDLLKNVGRASGHIFNLGHGVLPNTPVENVIELVNTVKKESMLIRK